MSPFAIFLISSPRNLVAIFKPLTKLLLKTNLKNIPCPPGVEFVPDLRTVITQRLSATSTSSTFLSLKSRGFYNWNEKRIHTLQQNATPVSD